MAPAKSTRAAPKEAAVTTLNNIVPLARKALTRRAMSCVQTENVDIMQTRGKRKAEHSPMKNEKVKRSALGNLTNNGKMTNIISTQQSEEDAKQQNIMKKENTVLKDMQNMVLQDMQNLVGSGLVAQQQQTQNKKPTTRAALRTANNKKVLDDKKNKITSTEATSNVKEPQMPAPQPPAAPVVVNAPVPMVSKTQVKPMRRISNEFNKTEESLYMSALEDISSCESMRLSGNFEAAKRRSVLLQQEKNKTELSKTCEKLETVEATAASPKQEKALPAGVFDFDKANWNDPFQVSNYAHDIFTYLKAREVEFPIMDYMPKQEHLTKFMRSLLVDWMVEVQETFELNHETLYLAVKIVDLYLCRVIINKDKLQLLGAAALFIACKYDERTPPLIEDFLYICDGAYQHEELVRMEIDALKTIDYDLGIPLSYRFLRRYARCAKVQMPTLTLARYILELSLMDYATISLSDSQLACAALFIALRMHGVARPWSATLQYYSGYKLVDFADVLPVLNAGLHRKHKGTIKTIRSKYSHKIFHEVAKVPLLSTEKLFEHNININASVAAAAALLLEQKTQ